jgi:hypothetical protein
LGDNGRPIGPPESTALRIFLVIFIANYNTIGTLDQ